MANLLLGHLLLGRRPPSQPPDCVQSLSGPEMLSQCLQRHPPAQQGPRCPSLHADPPAQSWSARSGLAPRPWRLRGWPSQVQAPFLSGLPGVAGAAALALSSGPSAQGPSLRLQDDCLSSAGPGGPSLPTRKSGDSNGWAKHPGSGFGPSSGFPRLLSARETAQGPVPHPRPGQPCKGKTPGHRSSGRPSAEPPAPLQGS